LALRTNGDSGGGALSFRVKDGTAKGCTIKGQLLTAKSTGTCVVTATRRARGATPEISSKPMNIRFDASASRPTTLTISFGAGASVLTTTAMAAIQTFVSRLTTGDAVVCTGYAKGNSELATRRAESVGRYVLNLINVRVTLRSVINGADNKVILTS